jgi:hypothetical protein
VFLSFGLVFFIEIRFNISLKVVGKLNQRHEKFLPAKGGEKNRKRRKVFGKAFRAKAAPPAKS